MKKIIDGAVFTKKSTLTPEEKLEGRFMDLEDEFRAGNFSSELPEVSIKLGDMYFEEDKAEKGSYYYPYQHYLIAKYALEQRIKHACQDGDKSLMEALIPKFEEVKALYKKKQEDKKKRLEYIGVKEDYSRSDYLEVVRYFVSSGSPLVNIDKTENRKYRITLTAQPYPDEEDTGAAKSLITIPEIDYCRLIEKIELISDYAPDILSSKQNNFNVEKSVIEDGKLIFLTLSNLAPGESEKIMIRIPLEGLGVSKIK